MLAYGLNVRAVLITIDAEVSSVHPPNHHPLFFT
jgi:hypothetical protein